MCVVGLTQVGIYHRWFRWLTEVVLHNRKFVLVNMDETGVANCEASKQGYWMATDPEVAGRTLHKASKGKADYTDQKTSLLGVICSDPLIQPHLRQLILPKYRGKKMPPKYMQELYADIGYPAQVVHGTTGWNDDACFRFFLLELRKVVYAIDPEMWIVLILDTCRVHVSRQNLLYIRSLGLLIILIPARLTWLLQMLDVYVFAELKRRLRMLTSMARIAAPNGVLDNGQWIPILGRVAREVLFQADWQRTFSKCGLCHDIALANKTIKGYLEQVTDRAPAKPTEEELLEILGMRPPKQAFRLVSWRSLLCGFPEKVLQEPERKPFRAEHTELPPVPPSAPLAGVFAPVPVALPPPVPTAQMDLSLPAPSSIPGPAHNVELPSQADRGSGPAARTRAQTRAQWLSTLPRAKRLPGPSASSRGPG